MKKREQGHITKRGEGRYLIRWRVNDDSTGKTRQVSETIHGDYGEAMAKLTEKCTTDQKGADDSPPRTFGDYMTNEWARYTNEHWKASTQVTQGSFVTRHIVPYFERMLLSDIKPTTIEAFHAAMEAKGLGRKTRHNLHSILTKMFSYAFDLELIEKTPVKKQLAPKLEKTEKPSLTEDQLMQLFDVVPVRYRAFFMTLALTGIRTGEALGLHWRDVDLANHQLQVRCAVYRGKETTPKTNTSIRPRPMAPELYRAFLNHKAMAVYVEPKDYVFASSTGRPFNPDQLREALQSSLARMGISFTQARADGMHLLRHSSGSMVYRHTGGDLKATQEWLGHSSSRITSDVYVHLAKDQQQKTAQTLEQAIFARPEAPGIVH